MEPVSGHDDIGHDEPSVHNWRVSQLKRLCLPGSLAEVYADRVDWHQIARLVKLAPWFSRRTVADLAAAFAGTSVPWARLHNLTG